MEQRKNAIGRQFQKIKRAGGKALITYISAGDPDVKTTKELVLAMEKNGVDLIELGMPYSDPVADGPVIQQASVRALRNGITIDAVFGLTASLRQETAIPLILMVYYNSVLQYGVRHFLEQCRCTGVDGLIVPDLPLEESEELRSAADFFDVDVIMLVAPTTPPERIARIARASKGFLYCVSVTGVTGTQKELDNGLQGFLATVRSQTEIPLAVGFGISTPEQAAQVSQMADGVIVGSAVIKTMERYLGKPELSDRVGEFVGSLKAGMTNAK